MVRRAKRRFGMGFQNYLGTFDIGPNVMQFCWMMVSPLFVAQSQGDSHKLIYELGHVFGHTPY